MSNHDQQENLYTTGDVAKLCEVSVRTVQYYDSRGILTPSQLSEGGRRLYTESDLQRMKIICFLRESGLSINSIGELLTDEDTDTSEVIQILVEQQASELKAEIKERQTQLEKLEQIRRVARRNENFSVESIADIANFMKNRKKLYRFRVMMIIMGVLLDFLEIATAILWISQGVWWPFLTVSLPLTIIFAVWISILYHKKIAYICPHCHAVFKPTFKQVFFANHTPTTRKLTCTVCGHRGFCVETYDNGK